jgi:hypothetical protein
MHVGVVVTGQGPEEGVRAIVESSYCHFEAQEFVVVGAVMAHGCGLRRGWWIIRESNRGAREGEREFYGSYRMGMSDGSCGFESLAHPTVTTLPRHDYRESVSYLDTCRSYLEHMARVHGSLYPIHDWEKTGFSQTLKLSDIVSRN